MYERDRALGSGCKLYGYAPYTSWNGGYTFVLENEKLKKGGQTDTDKGLYLDWSQLKSVVQVMSKTMQKQHLDCGCWKIYVPLELSKTY